MWYIYSMECYSAIQKNKIMPSAVRWMDLKIVIQKMAEKQDEETTFSLTNSSKDHLNAEQLPQNNF